MKVVGPDQSDIEKFNESKFGWCPNCFKEIYDDSIRCCYCNEFVQEKVLNAHPEISNFNRRGRYLLAFLIKEEFFLY